MNVKSDVFGHLKRNGASKISFNGPFGFGDFGRVA
jgi:hypothetical protein